MEIENGFQAAAKKELLSNSMYEKTQVEHGALAIWTVLTWHWQMHSAQLLSAWIIEPLKDESVDAFKHSHNFIWNILPKED